MTLCPLSLLKAYVFVVGGGNYIEYQNLQDYCRRQQNAKRITYGTSQLMNARQFLAQVSSMTLSCMIGQGYESHTDFPLQLSELGGGSQ